METVANIRAATIPQDERSLRTRYTLCMDLSVDGSVFEGLQIIYSPFRRRVLFSFDRFTSDGGPTADQRRTCARLLRRNIAPARAHVYLYASVTFFSAESSPPSHRWIRGRLEKMSRDIISARPFLSCTD